MRSYAVSNIAGTARFWQAAYGRRVDEFIVGDSETLQNTVTGTLQGRTYALAAMFGLYGGPSMCGSYNGLYNTGVLGMGCSLYSGSATFPTGTEPAAFSALRFPYSSSKLNSTAFSASVAACTISAPITGTTPYTFTLTRATTNWDAAGFAGPGSFKISGAANASNNGCFEYVSGIASKVLTLKGYLSVAEGPLTLTVSQGVAGGEPWGNLDWCNTFIGNLDAPGTFLGCQFPLDLNGALAYAVTMWRPAAGGITQMLPTIHDSAAVGGIGFYELSAGLRKTTTCPTRASDGIDTVRTNWARGTIIDPDSATPGGAQYRGTGLLFRPRFSTGDTTPIDGTNTFGVVAQRIEDAECFRGVSLSLLYAMGGANTRDAATDLCNFVSDTALALRIRAAVHGQIDAAGNLLPPMLHIRVKMGGNDANDSTDSMLSTTGVFGSASAQAGVAGNTATGYKNNTLTLIRRIRYVWTTVLGYSASNLFFTIGYSMPQAQASTQWTFVRTTQVTGMAAVLAAEVGANITTIDCYKLGTFPEYGNTGTATPLVNSAVTPWTGTEYMPWFRNGQTDSGHLNEPGYYHSEARELQAVLQAAAGGITATSAAVSGGIFSGILQYIFMRNRNQ